jgi:hypothetical protein
MYYWTLITTQRSQSDFGLAKLIDGDQSQSVTHHIAGT